MKILGLKFLSRSEKRVEKYLSQLEKSLDNLKQNRAEIDVAVGPDYALTGYKDIYKDLVDFTQYDYALKRLQEISKKHKKTVIFPGTALINNGNGEMALVCPVFYKGDKKETFYKETDRGETETARKNCLTYMRGNNSRNRFNIKGINSVIEICSDYGHQEIPDNTDLEIIMAFDQNGNLRKPGIMENPIMPRYEFIVNGIDRSLDKNIIPQVILGFYSPDFKINCPIQLINPEIETQEFLVFNLPIDKGVSRQK